MKDSRTFTHLSEKLKDRLAEYEWQLGLALLVIACYLRTITLKEGGNSSRFWVRQLHFFLWGVSIFINYLIIYKKFFSMLYKEFFSVLIRKEKSWLTVDEKAS